MCEVFSGTWSASPQGLGLCPHVRHSPVCFSGAAACSDIPAHRMSLQESPCTAFAVPSITVCCVSVTCPFLCHGELSVRDVTLWVMPRAVSMRGGLSFPCREHSLGGHAQSVLRLCGCALRHSGRQPPVWCRRRLRCRLCQWVTPDVLRDPGGSRKVVLGHAVAACFVSLSVCVATCVGVYGVPFVACQSEAMPHFRVRGPAPHPHPRGYYSRSRPCEAPKPIPGCWGFCVCVAVHCGSLLMSVPTVLTTCLNGSGR